MMSDDAATQAAKAAGFQEAMRSLDPDTVQKVVQLRGRLQVALAQVVMAMAAAPRYRYVPLKDISEMVLEPLMRDRIAIATPNPEKADPIAKDTMAGVAIWATVSDEVEEKIREQIKAGVFPLRLAPSDWTSGDNTWLLDVIAPSKPEATAVFRHFAAQVKKGPMKLHPLISRSVDLEALKKMASAEVVAEGAGSEDVAGNGATPNGEASPDT